MKTLFARTLFAMIVLIAILCAMVAPSFAQGTSIPGNLNVRGNANIEKNLSVHGTTTQTGDFTASGTVTGATISSTDDVLAGGDLDADGGLKVDGTSTLGANTNYATTVRGNLIQAGPLVTLAGATTVTNATGFAVIGPTALRTTTINGATTVTNASGLTVIGPTVLNSVWHTNVVLTAGGLTNTTVIQAGVIISSQE